MNCPVCTETMLVIELDQIEIDYCPHCRGIWLDAGELELLLDGSAEKDRFLTTLAPADAGGEKSRKCPHCRKKMGKIHCGPERRICLDRCPKGHGLWFDPGELQQVLELAHFNNHDRDDKILSLLKSMMGKS